MEDANRGDCVTTSVASVLDIPLDEMPDMSAYGCYMRGKSQTAAVLQFLRERGYDADFFYDKSFFGKPWPVENFDPSGLAITLVYLGMYNADVHTREIGEVTHCVVTYDGKLFWDPMGILRGDLGDAYAWIFPTRDRRRIVPSPEEFTERERLAHRRSWIL